MLAKVHSSIVIGVDGQSIEVEVDISSGLPVFATVGLPDGAVRESKDRVKVAIKNSGYDFPPKRITVNLAPADIKKVGSNFDLPIAVGVLVASGVIKSSLYKEYSMVGELSLDGSLRGVKGVLPMVLASKVKGLKGIIVPVSNSEEASLVEGIDVIAFNYLCEAVKFFTGEITSQPFTKSPLGRDSTGDSYRIDFLDVKGQENVKRALEIAASGGHNILMKGPPGSGKTMLSRRLPTILPDLTLEEAIETTKIHSVAGTIVEGMSCINSRPFRAPHHTISDAGLVGGGTLPKPGEVSLANNGVLFLDELLEFKRNVLEVLRQPLEDGVVTISRANNRVTFPARFVLVAAMNPCPCGYLGDKQNECHCNEAQVQRYMSRLSGPLLDRIDIYIEVASISFNEISKKSHGESSLEIKKRVQCSRNIQKTRFKSIPGVHCNGQMSSSEIEKYCHLDDTSLSLLRNSMEKLALSARAYHRILKISRTIADMNKQERINKNHLAEAIQFRRLKLL